MITQALSGGAEGSGVQIPVQEVAIKKKLPSQPKKKVASRLARLLIRKKS
jgi:hypothetical protein